MFGLLEILAAYRKRNPSLSEDLGDPLPNPLKYLPCLRCGDLMIRRQFRWRDKSAGVVLDHCREHGVWLDAEELERVLSFVRARAGSPDRLISTAEARGSSSSLGLDLYPVDSGDRSVLDGLLELLGDWFS